MKFLFAFVSTLVLATMIGAAASAADDDIGPATATVSHPVLTVDPASDMLNGRITAHNDAIEAENQAAEARYQGQLADYQAEKKAQAAAYDAQLAEHDAKVAADMAAWSAHQPNCAVVDNDRCAPDR
jgi:Skp family chaperone for outer membrane proteins